MDIKPYSKNAKKHPDEQLRQIALSLQEYTGKTAEKIV